MGHWRSNEVTVFGTNKCNMGCIYCVAETSKEKDHIQAIDLDFAKRGILDFFNASSDNTKLRFYSGGEPTQDMEVLHETTDYARSLIGERLVVEMQTNGYFDETVAEWIAQNVDIVWVSMDGWPEVNDKYRPVPNDNHPSKKLLRNIKYLQERTFVGIRATVVSETVARQEELVEFFHSIGIEHIYSEPVFEPVGKTGRDYGVPITGVNSMEYARNYILGWRRAEQLGIFYGNSFMVNFDEKVRINCRSCLPAPHLTTDGFVSACDLAFYGNTPLQDFIYGKWVPEQKRIIYFPERVMKLRSRTAENMRECQGCPILFYCAGGCVGRAYHERGNMFGKVPDYCRITKYLAKHMPVGKIRIEHLHP